MSWLRRLFVFAFSSFPWQQQRRRCRLLHRTLQKMKGLANYSSEPVIMEIRKIATIDIYTAEDLEDLLKVLHFRNSLYLRSSHILFVYADDTHRET